MSGQKFDLTWQTFSSHATEMFRELLATNQFADVSLICHDLTKIQAHRIVLSACSSVFREILQGHKEGHPVIYLRGVQRQELESLLQFMYNAEVSFSEDRLNEFLKVAKDLDIKEIAENVDIAQESSNENAACNGQEKDITRDIQNENRNIVPPTRRPNSAITTGKAHHYCDECDAEYKTYISLCQHRRSVHQGVQFSCNQCNYKATQKNNLKTHIQLVHGGLVYPCNQCEYKATQKSDLKRHIKFQHRE